MNLIKDEYFKFKHIENSTNKSAIIKCLENETNIELYKKWIAKEYNTIIEDDKVITRLNLILELKERLDKVQSEKNKQQILNYLSRLLSAKFSGSKQSDTIILLTLEKLVYAFENKKPIIFIFGFGGYKNYNPPLFPEVDFSELFHMKYMTEFLWPIITTYQYGVTFEYESEEISIQFNNVPQESTDRYTRSFRNLLEYFINKVERVNNVKLDYKLIMARDLYNSNDLYIKMKEYYPAMLEEFNKLSSVEKEVWLKRARTNYLTKGTEDFTTINKEELDNKILEARINNECFLAADYELRVDFWERPNAISLFGTWGKTPCASPTDGGLHLKSTKSSNTDFWIGTGIFKVDNDNNILQELILSHNQYEEVKNGIKHLKSNNEELKLVSNNFNSFPYIK